MKKVRGMIVSRLSFLKLKYKERFLKRAFLSPRTKLHEKWLCKHSGALNLFNIDPFKKSEIGIAYLKFKFLWKKDGLSLSSKSFFFLHFSSITLTGGNPIASISNIYSLIRVGLCFNCVQIRLAVRGSFVSAHHHRLDSIYLNKFLLLPWPTKYLNFPYLCIPCSKQHPKDSRTIFWDWIIFYTLFFSLVFYDWYKVLSRNYFVRLGASLWFRNSGTILVDLMLSSAVWLLWCLETGWWAVGIPRGADLDLWGER